MWILVGTAALFVAWFVAAGLKNRFAYDVRKDYRYPLAPDARFPCRIVDGRLELEGGSVAALGDHSLLLAVRLRSEVVGRIRDPYIRLASSRGEVRQYFERGVGGLRFVDASAFAGGEAPNLQSVYCGCDAQAELLAFRNPDLEGALLLLAPHPDDAELAAFGLYSRQAATTTLVTVSAGESVKALGKQYIPALDGDLAAACRRKGVMRAFDAVTAPRWGGVAAESVVMLGYFNETLRTLEQNPEKAVSSRFDPALKPADFRRFNAIALPSDAASENRWDLLVGDLADLVRRVQPAIVVMPHPAWDPHPDHGAATRALEAALSRSSHRPRHVLYYCTHIRGTADHPFGPPHCAAGPAPNFNEEGESVAYFSLPLPMEMQQRKVCALEAMHDLRSAPRLQKRLKALAQRVVAGRAWPRYGEHAYFRTAIKGNEIFWVAKRE